MKDIEKSLLEAKEALTQKPLFATSVERVSILNEIKSEYNGLPHPLRFAKHLSVLLARVSVPVEEHDLIAGRSVDRELDGEEEQMFAEYIKHKDYQPRHTFIGSGHCTYSWDMIVENGIGGMRRIVEESLKATEDTDKRIFLTAVIEVYDAISSYMMRYADEAEKKGKTDLAKLLRSVAYDRPDSFASALQLLWIVAFINCAYITLNPTLTVGRLDKILYPLYRKDIDSGVMSREQAKEYITDYYCKHNLIMGRGEHQVGDTTNSTTFERICNFDAPQYLQLCGTDEDGREIANELTELFAQCIVPEFKNPVIVVQYVKGMENTHPLLWRTLTDKALESASLMFYNDGNVRATLERIGIPADVAREYAHFGCNWCSLGDVSAWMANGPSAASYGVLSDEEKRQMCIPYMRVNADHGWPEDLMIVLREMVDENDPQCSIDTVYSRFLSRMGEFVERKLKVLSRELNARKRAPSAVLSYTDCFTRASLKNGECISAGVEYHFEQQAFQMFATVVDSIIAIDKLVFIEKKLTLKELLKAVDANFEGYAAILTMCRKADKYGSDTELSNMHAQRLSRAATDLVIEKSRAYLKKEKLFLMPCMQSDTWHLKYGEQYGATPNGRAAYTSFSQNTRPSNGSCTNGITGMFNSMLMLPSNGLTSGALNLDVDQKQFEGDGGKELFSVLLATYFNRGGLHAQVTCTGAERLIEAQNDPEHHKDIRVRVTGYSGVFVDISKRLQDDIIERFK